MTPIPYCEFYIVHNCNLACPGCNRFNDHKFTGFQRWADYKDVYKEWSKRVSLTSCAILGGEPMLNPTFMEWVNGISDLWPHAAVRIISNGFLLDKQANLYNQLSQNKRLHLWVGIHNKEHKQKIIQKVKDFTVAPHTTTFNTDNPYQQYLEVTDANGVVVRIEYNWWFHQGSLIKDGKTTTLYNSNSSKAHNNCHMKTCHHFYKGKLYKCGVVAVLPDFDEQHQLLLDTNQRQLLNSYVPLDITATDQETKDFINQLPNEIPQCQFCPEEYNGDQIFALEKKNL